MQSVSLFDTVSVSNDGKKDISLSSNLPFIPNDERNIAYKATKLFYEVLGKNPKGINIHLDKHIPVGGGMGGGSSNCSAVLLALNDIEKNPFSLDELLKIGGSLGADVPFTMIGGAALATGIGDVLTPVKGLPPCYIVLCKPRFSINTKSAFMSLTPSDFSKDARSEKMAELLSEGNLEKISKSLFNSFEAPVAKLKPDILKIKNKLLDCGAEGALMTGSCSTVYGIFSNLKKATIAKECIGKCIFDTFVVKPVNI